MNSHGQESLILYWSQHPEGEFGYLTTEPSQTLGPGSPGVDNKRHFLCDVLEGKRVYFPEKSRILKNTTTNAKIYSMAVKLKLVLHFSSL